MYSNKNMDGQTKEKPPSGDSDILKLLLEGQQRMSQDIRDSLAKQEQHDRDIERTKSNVLSLGYRLGEVFNQQHEIVDALDYNSHDIQSLRG